MKAQEILNMHKRLNRRLRKDARKNDKALLILAQSDGWEVLRANIEEMIAELLEPVEFDNYATLEMRNVVYESRATTIKALRAIISIPDVVLAAHRSEVADRRAAEGGNT